MIDFKLLGETTARLMDEIESNPPTDEEGDPIDTDGMSILGVGIVVAMSDASKENTYYRTFCSDTELYRQVGLFSMALECANDGV